MSLLEISERLMDLPFVSRVMRTQRLDPMPVQGFYLDPQAWSENGEFKRIIEKYKWGAVLFLSNIKAELHCTVIVHGDFVSSSGLVTSRGPRKEQVKLGASIPWYPDMVRSLGGKQVPQVEFSIPECLGFHEDDAGTDNPICDGGYIATKDVTERPCAWKPNCIALQTHCARLAVLPGDVLNGMPKEKIVQLTTRLREEIAKGQVSVPEAQAVAQARASQPKPGPLPKQAAKPLSPATAVPRKASAVAPPQPVDGLQLEMGGGTVGAALLQQTWDSLKLRLKRNFVTSRDLAKPGDIFAQDRSRSGYVSLYCEPAGGRRIAIVEIKLKTDKIHALFPFPPDSKLLVGADAKPVSDGKFISIVSNIPGPTVNVTKLVDILVKAIDSGAIPLPK